MGKLDGKVAVVTGSGRGIGRAIVMLLAEEGACVTVNDIDEEPASQTAKEIEEAGGKATWCVADITKAEEAQKLVDTAVEKFGRLNILVNNAGIIRDSAIHRMTDSQWDVCLDINLKGIFNCIRAASEQMRKVGGGGRIINITSVAGLMGNPGQINYSAAKAGVLGITKAVAKEWARFDVTCNAVAYGFVDTRMTKEKEEAEVVMGEKVGIPKASRDVFLAKYEGRVLSPEEAARPVLFLASEDAAFVSGNVIHVTPLGPGRYM